MRLDKFLKVSRIIKRRTIANEACDAGKVMVNGKVARASLEVKVSDRIDITMGNKPFSCVIAAVNEYVTKDTASDNYRVVE
jgi:ribosomal 50S subunit-recycling heat shock protein